MTEAAPSIHDTLQSRCEDCIGDQGGEFFGLHTDISITSMLADAQEFYEEDSSFSFTAVKRTAEVLKNRVVGLIGDEDARPEEEFVQLFDDTELTEGHVDDLLELIATNSANYGSGDFSLGLSRIACAFCRYSKICDSGEITGS